MKKKFADLQKTKPADFVAPPPKKIDISSQTAVKPPRVAIHFEVEAELLNQFKAVIKAQNEAIRLDNDLIKQRNKGKAKHEQEPTKYLIKQKGELVKFIQAYVKQNQHLIS